MPVRKLASCFGDPQDAGFVLNEIIYSDLAVFFYYQKALFLGDMKSADKILKVKTREKLKLIGDHLTVGSPLKGWAQTCLNVLQQGLKAKFSQDYAMRTLLYRLRESDLRVVESLWGLTAHEVKQNLHADNFVPGSNPLGDTLIHVRRQLYDRERIQSSA